MLRRLILHSAARADGRQLHALVSEEGSSRKTVPGDLPKEESNPEVDNSSPNLDYLDPLLQH